MLKTEYNDCNGCTACFNICDANAINMVINHEGFKYPVVDNKICTQCNLCNDICPALSGFKSNTCLNLYSSCAKDQATLLQSSSGGIFTLVAEHIISSGGYICAAKFDDKLNLAHALCNSIDELTPFKGSKYMQSELSDIYSDLKELLDIKKQVLFVGTPCQVAGLLNFLQKPYTNLLTIDLVCHGVPPQKMFHKYLKDIVKTDTDERYTFSFRDKGTGWKNYSINATQKDATDVTLYTKLHKDDLYMRGFLKDIYLRECCYRCKFSNVERVGDITLGDFWGVGKYKKTLDNDLGTSMIMVNTEKGVNMISAISSNTRFLEKTPLNIAVNGNPCLVKPVKRHPARDIAFNLLNSDMKFEDLIDRCLSPDENIAILSLYATYTRNFGNNLVAYATQAYLKKMGYRSEILELRDKNYLPIPSFNKFADKHITRRIIYKEQEDITLLDLNSCFSKFIVGSDQVWRYKYTHNNLHRYYLSFVNLSKHIIAYAASYGTDKYETEDPLIIDLIKYYLGRFDWISVREDSGVDICKNTFGQTATHVLDPVFLLTKDDWIAISNESNVEIRANTIVTYILDSNQDTDKLVEHISNTHNKEVVNIYKSNEITDWLIYIQNADMVVTDSFHGVCFSIIFNKKFLCIANEDRGLTRFTSILSTLELSSRIILSPTEFDYSIGILSTDIDYNVVNTLLGTLKDRSSNFLINAIDNKNQKVYKKTLSSKVATVSKVLFKQMKNISKYHFYRILSNITVGDTKIKFNNKKKYCKKVTVLFKNISKSV